MSAGHADRQQNKLAKELVPANDTPHKIAEIQFGLLSAQDMSRVSHLRVVNRELFVMPQRTPFPHGVLDTRLGVSNKSSVCATCGMRLADCAGHFGDVKLELPVFHVGYFKAVLNICQTICKRCSRVMLTDEERAVFLARYRSRIDNLIRKDMVVKVVHKCKKVRTCPHCNFFNGVVKKVGPFRISHERYPKTKSTEPHVVAFHNSFADAMHHNKDIKQFLGRAQDDLNPFRVLRLFENIPAEDCELLDLDNEHGRPERLIMTHILVPPVCIRPSVAMGTAQGSNEDDLTMKLTEIISINNMLRTAMEKGASMTIVMENWDFLQLQTALYINADISGLPLSMQKASKSGRSFVQRLKGKQGRFRGNLSGKRVDFSARTVISPDPNLLIHQVGVPVDMAMILTYPERVNRCNKRFLRQLVINGPTQHPGANFVEKPDGFKRFLKYGNRHQIAKDLREGDIVERHLIDNDVVLFNRQPSLHKLSIMSHRAKVLQSKTLRFNECVCAPYNADFDGDEMNLHLPQTEEAKAEASVLMGVENNLVTPRNGDIIIAATQDFITAAWLLTKKNAFFDRAEFCQLCAACGDAMQTVVLPPPAIFKPVELWTGKQVFNVMLAPARNRVNMISLVQKGRNYSANECMCINDSYIVIRNSELLCGNLDKKLLGDGNKNSVFSVLMREVSPAYSARCMSRLAKFTSRFLLNQGFSIGIDDVMPPQALLDAKAQLLGKGYAKCQELIDEWKSGQLVPQPGCNAEQTLEAVINKELSNIRGDAGKICIRELDWRNAALNMALAGSKGSPLNISQMIACVGQQTVGGTRVPNGFVDRSLPHFHKRDRAPAAKGFVSNSFYSGLTPSEFFFHTMGGREGLVDTAVKTAETGYMQRRLMKTLEDLSVHYDYTVRNSEMGIVQFAYGDDLLDPAAMEGCLDPSDRDANDLSPVDFNRALLHAKALHFSPSVAGLSSAELRDAARDIFASHPDTAKCGPHFLAMVDKFVQGLVKSLADAEALADSLNLHDELVRATWMKPHYLSRPQLENFLDQCFRKCVRAAMEPGTAVGALAGQSIGEPGTQMTLKTFHFAGVASMNVTLGVPRLKEIINASKTISTPIITAALDVSNNETVARIVKGRIEKTQLGGLCKSISEVYDTNYCYLSLELDLDTIRKLQLDVDVESVKAAILRSKLKIKPENIYTKSTDTIKVLPGDTAKERMIHDLQRLRKALPEVIVSGIPSVERAVLHTDQKSGKEFKLLVEGTNLSQVMGTIGVKGSLTSSNHIVEVEHTLGIEAARRTVMNEIGYTMGAYGIQIDARHVMLLADVMSYRGHILGITRFGLSKMKESVLMLASFEQTTDHLFDAAVHARRDKIVGVSECIIMGIPMPIGTGCFKLIHRLDKVQLRKSEPLIFACTERSLASVKQQS